MMCKVSYQRGVRDIDVITEGVSDCFVHQSIYTPLLRPGEWIKYLQ